MRRLSILLLSLCSILPAGDWPDWRGPNRDARASDIRADVYSLGCVLFHLVAAGLTSALLAVGESTLFRLFAALHRVLAPARIRPVVELAPGWTAVITDGAGGSLLEDAVAAAVSRRGPPAVA